MSHRRRRGSETAFLCMNRASAIIGCQSLRICSPYRLFVLYHRSITAFAKRTKALPPLNTLARGCWNSRRSFGFTFVATCILALLSDFVNQFRYCRLLRSSWFKLIAAHAIAMQDFHLQDIPIPWHTYIQTYYYSNHLHVASESLESEITRQTSIHPCFRV